MTLGPTFPRSRDYRMSETLETGWNWGFLGWRQHMVMLLTLTSALTSQLWTIYVKAMVLGTSNGKTSMDRAKS